MQSFDIPSEAAMLELGNCWAHRLGGGAVMFLAGDLGAGKTTLARGILGGLGHRGAVTSPTYTLVEHYPLPAGDVYHVDLYRLEHPAELEMLGLRDALDGASTLLVEWPERGAGQMPAPDFQVDICCLREGRRVRVRSADGVAQLPQPGEKPSGPKSCPKS